MRTYKSWVKLCAFLFAIILLFNTQVSLGNNHLPEQKKSTATTPQAKAFEFFRHVKVLKCIVLKKGEKPTFSYNSTIANNRPGGLTLEMATFGITHSGGSWSYVINDPIVIDNGYIGYFTMPDLTGITSIKLFHLYDTGTGFLPGDDGRFFINGTTTVYDNTIPNISNLEWLSPIPTSISGGITAEVY